MGISPASNFSLFEALGIGIVLFFSQLVIVCNAEEFKFNTDVLDVDDRKNIDLSYFARSGYIMPGTYDMTIHVNKIDLPESQVEFLPAREDAKTSEACLSHTLVPLLGLKKEVLSTLLWVHGGRCLDIQSLPGMKVRGDLATFSLYLNIPQAYLEYTAENWDPPSRWDNGILGVLFDYNLNALIQKNQKYGSNSYSLSGTGTAGVNAGPWRLRADWQARFKHQKNSSQSAENKLEWSRYYACRAIPELGLKLIIGEDYLSSGIFDSFRFTGASLQSDDNMLPPNLRGYAPEVTGVAKTNAKVSISQLGRVLYETQVAAGPFRIQDLNDAMSGELNVRVEEQDGSVQQFTINTASIPYLTRPGQVRYKLAAGQPSEWPHRYRGPLFSTGEFSWGVNNGWSLYGGALGAGSYNALSLGVGRDLLILGALSFDATQSLASLPEESERKTGGSYRLSYSKDFVDYDSQVTIAGYRFSQRDFMSMAEYLDARYSNNRAGNSKSMYMISVNKSFRDSGLSAYLNYSHQTYWDRSPNDRYSLMVSRYFGFGQFRNLSVSLSASQTRYLERNDHSIYLSLSMPWGQNATVSYNTTFERHNNSQSMTYSQRLNSHDNYQITAGHNRQGADINGYYSHEADAARITANAAWRESSFTALGMTAQGGITLTTEGGALHRVNTSGGTRLLLDTGGVAGVPVRGYGSTVRTNVFGKAVVGDVNSYYRSRASIDVTKLADDAEAVSSVVQATLTEGAIGYRRFDIISGARAMAIIKLSNGGVPPFGASVFNRREQETGLVNEGGAVYLSGINAGEIMTVHWNGKSQCEIKMPALLPADLLSSTLLLPCVSLLAKQKLN